MKKLEVRFTRSADDVLWVGTLAEDRGRVYFEYTTTFLESGFSLSPFHLPFEPGLHEHRHDGFGPLPGVFDDSLPDGWGLLLMDRHFRSIGWNMREISPLERLAWLGTRTMGALNYHPPADRKEAEQSVFDLHDLASQSHAVLEGAAEDVLPQLLHAGGSPGGARPKVLVGYNPHTGQVMSGEDDLPKKYEHWIVKFTAKTDAPDTGAMEYAYSLMARAAGVDMSPTRLFETAHGDRFFGIKRFDRGSTPSSKDRNRRYHVHTFGNLIHSNFRVPSADYADLLKTTWVLTRNHEDVLRAYRRMVFNVLAHNRDDHVKNFAFVLDDTTGEWTMTPAYDLLFTQGPGGEHTMTVAGEGRHPNRSHMIRLAEQGDITAREAESIIEQVQAAVAQWPSYASKAGVENATAKQIAESLPTLA